MLSVRIVTTDHYMAPPVRDVDVCYSEFRGTEVKRVPVMRVYGATEAGQKTCMHIHGIFPYLYVPYDGSEPVQKYLRQVAMSLDKAVNIGMGKAASTMQHVYKITLVTAVPFYGYHDREQQFLKIYLYNPFMVKRVADLLLGGAIMNKILQPHESHIPYNLQAFIDYNLYGMNMIKVAAAKFRQPDDGLPAEAFTGDSHSQRSFSLNTPPQEMHWDVNSIPSDAWLPPTVPRQSSCELEVDVVAADVLNRIDIGENIGTNPGLAALWDDERQRRREHADDSQISPPSSPDRGSIPWTDDEAELQERLRNILIDLQPYISEGDEATPDSSQKESTTPSSQVKSHHSLADDLFSLSSQDTVILEADTSSDTEPIVNETSILRVVSSSQSFQGSAPKSAAILDSTQDQQLAQMLAAMGEDVSQVPCSQAASQALSRVATMEEADSILSQTSSSQVMDTPEEQADEEEQEERDMLDLSQSAWGEEIPEAGADADNNESSAQLNIDMEGMDQSWNSSQWVEVLAAKGEEEEGLPQYDGPADDKSETQSSTKKRLGMLGATLPTFKVKTIGQGAFSITAKTNEDTLITFTSSTKMHPIRTNKAKPASKQTKPGPASRTSPIAAPQSLRIDLRTSEFQQVSEGTDDEEHSSARAYKKRPQEGVAKAVVRVSGKNSPKEASRASDAFVELSSRSHTKQTSQHKAAAGRESRAATAKPNSKPNAAPKRGSTTRRREGRHHDNIFASLASELHPPMANPKQKAKSPPKDTPNTTSSKPSTVNDARFEMFMKKSRARLSSASTIPKGSTVTETTTVNKTSDKKPPRINSKTIKQKGVKRTELTSEDEFRESENEFEGKRLLIPRRRSSDSSSENEVPAQPEMMKAPSCPQKKPNGEIKSTFVAPTVEDESERVEKASEVSDDQMSLRVDPDPESDHEMWDQTGCDDLPVIVDLPADPMSISDNEQQDDGPLTYEEHSTVIVSIPSRNSPKARKISGSEKKSSHGHDSKQRQHSRTSTEKDTPPTQTAYSVSKAKLKWSSIEVSKTSPVHDAHHSSDALMHTEAQPKPEAGKSCISLAERKRKLSLKRLLKKRENALEQLRRHSSHNVSDTDSYTSTELTLDSPVLQKMVVTEPAVNEHSAVLSPQQNEASLDLFLSSDSSPLRSFQDHFPRARGRGRARRGGKSPAGGTSPASPPEKIGKRSQRGRRGRGRGQRPAFQSHASMDEQDSVWFSASNYINYYNGLRVCLQNRKTRHMAEEASNRVRVLKTDCQKYHLTDVGQEKLDLHNMNPYELIHSEEYLPTCDRRYRTCTVDLSYQKKSTGRAPGWKKQQDASGSRSEMLTTPGEDISMEIIDISSLTAEASMLKRCEQRFSSMEQSEGNVDEGKQSRSISPMEEELVKTVSISPVSLTNTSLSPKPDDHSASLEPVFLSTKPGPKSSKRRLQPSKDASQPCVAHTIHTSKSSELSKSASLPSKTSAESTKASTPSSNTATLSSEQSNQSVKPATQSSKHVSKFSLQSSLSSEQNGQPLEPLAQSSRHTSKSSSKSSKQESQSSKSTSLSSEQSGRPVDPVAQSSRRTSKSSLKSSKQESQSSKSTSLSSEQSGRPVDPVAQPSRRTSKSSLKSSKQESQSSKSTSLSSQQSGRPVDPVAQSSRRTSKSSSKSSKQESQSSKPASLSSEQSGQPVNLVAQSSRHSSKSSTQSSKQESQSSKSASLSSEQSGQPVKPATQCAEPTSKCSQSSKQPSQPSKPRSQSLKPSSHSPRAALKSSKQTVSKSSPSQSPKAALLSSKQTSQPSKHSLQSSKSSSKLSMQSVKPASERSNSPQVSKPAPLSVPTSAVASAKGDSATRSHPTTPRQPLLENQQSEAKGDMSVVDFSLLENPIDNDVVAILSTDADPHHQLHTPPLVMDAAKEQSSPHADAGPSVSGHSNVHDSQGGKVPSTVPMDSDLAQQGSDQAMSSDDDGQNTVDYNHDETLTETDLYSDSNAGSPSPSNSDGNSEVVRIGKTLRKKDSVSTEDSLTNDPTGHSSKKRHARRPSLKMKFKKVNSESSSEAPDNQTESGEERRQRKRRKVEQIDHYRFRAKRATGDYSSEAFSHIYKLESTKSAAPQIEEVRDRKRKLKPKDNIQYIIINKFKGYRSMRVLLEKLDVDADEVVRLSDFKRRKKQKRRHISQINTHSFGTVRQIVSDVPHENQSDPLWEEQIERLGGDDGDADNDDDDDGSGGSSDDESSQDSTNAEESRPRKGQYGTTGKGPKKRVMSYHKRMSNAFCTKTRRPKRKSEQTKIWNTLSLLHDATVAQLTSPNATYDDQVDKDHKLEYVDVMYKLALFSPPQSEHGGDSPPQPLSPASPREDQEAAIQEQDDGPRKKPSAAYHTAMLPKIAQLQQSSLDDSQGEMSLTKSPVHLLKSSARSSAANSPSGSDPEAHFGSRQALSSEYNSSGMNPNNTGSPYAVKETIVHFNPLKASLFNKGYSKDNSPPDLGPPTLHQMSPHSLSSNSGSPPELLYHDRDLHQQQKQQSSSSTSLSEAYSNFFGTMPAVTNNEKKSSNRPVTSHSQIIELTNKSDKVEKRSPSKGQEKNSSTAKSSHRSLSLKKSRPGASSSSAVDLTKDDVPSLPIVSETVATASTCDKSSTQTVTNQMGKEDTTTKSHSTNSAACVDKKEYKHQHTKKKVLARFGIDMQASKEKDKELALRKSVQKEVQPSEEMEMPKRPEIVPEKRMVPARKEKDAEKKSKARKKSDASKDNQRSQQINDELQQSSSESSSEEEYACIRSQTPPQSPGASEPIQSEQKENPEKTKKEEPVAKTESGSSDDDEEEETDEEMRKPEAALSPIRSPSPVPFNTQCDAAVPMVPTATPRHPGISDYQMPPPGLAYSAPNWPTRFDEPTSPQDLRTQTTLKSSKTKDVPRFGTAPRYSLQPRESSVDQQKKENDVSNRLPSKIDKPQAKDKLQFERIIPSQQEKKKSLHTAAEKTTESDAEKTAASDTEMDASSKTSEESEDETESVARKCQRTDSPIRSPSPELRDLPTKEESKDESIDVNQSLPGTLQRGGRDENLSKSDLFSPSNDARSANDSSVIPQSDEKKEDVKDDASTDSETEEDSEEDEDGKEKVVCSPIRSLSPPASPSNPKREHPETTKSPVFNIPTNITQKHTTEDKEKESSNSESSDNNDDDDDKDTIQNCERLSIPIRSPSPTIETSPVHNTEKTASADTQPECDEPQERLIPNVDESKAHDDKDDSEGADKKNGQVSPEMKKKVEEVSKSESEGSSDDNEGETEDEDDVSVPAQMFSPIRSPSPPALSSSELFSPEPQERLVPSVDKSKARDDKDDNEGADRKKGQVSPEMKKKDGEVSKRESEGSSDDNEEETKGQDDVSVPAQKFSLIRSPSPPPLSSSELFSHEPQERLVPSVDKSKARDDKDDNEGADKKNGQVSPEMKKKVEEVSKRESEGSSDDNEEETEDEDDVSVPAQMFSPIRSPSPPLRSPPQENDVQSKEDNHVNKRSSSPTSKDDEDDTHKSVQLESTDDSGEETEEEDDQRSVQMGIFSPIRSPSPPHLSPAEPVKDDGDEDISSKPPEIPVSIMGSPNPQESCALPLSPSPSPKRRSPERAIPEIRVVKMAGPINTEKLQSRFSNVIGNKRSLSVSPVPSPHAAPSEREEGEVRTDDETQEECELNDLEEKHPSKEAEAPGEVVQNGEKEDGELTETSTCRSSPPPSPITISSTDELSSVKRSIGRPELKSDQPIKDENSETTEESKTSKTEQTTPSETDKEEMKEAGDKEERAEESSDEDSEDDVVSRNVKYSSPIRSPSPAPGADDTNQHNSSTPTEDAAEGSEREREEDGAAAEQKSSSESEESDSEPSRMGTPRSIRSPSPIQSPDHETDADPKVSVEDSIQSPSPIQSPDQGMSLDRSGQPAVIPLTIDTSVGDPRMKRLLMHPVPSPLASSKCTDRNTDQHGSDHSEDEAEVAAQVDEKRVATGKQTSGRGNANEGSNKETHSSGHGREQNEKAGDKNEGKQPSHPSEMSPEGKHPPTDTSRSTKSNDVQSVITPAIAPPSRKSVSDSARQSEVAHREAFYSDPQDAQQQRPR